MSARPGGYGGAGGRAASQRVFGVIPHSTPGERYPLLARGVHEADAQLCDELGVPLEDELGRYLFDVGGGGIVPVPLGARGALRGRAIFRRH